MTVRKPAHLHKPNGRPSSYTEEIGRQICALIGEGKSLRSVCRMKAMPAVETVRRWLGSFPQFREQYARAREEAVDVYAEEILEIADRRDLDPRQKAVMIDARKWTACKLKPKKYGDRLATEVSGPDGGPIVVNVTSAESQY